MIKASKQTKKGIVHLLSLNPVSSREENKDSCEVNFVLILQMASGFFHESRFELTFLSQESCPFSPPLLSPKGTSCKISL